MLPAAEEVEPPVQRESMHRGGRGEVRLVALLVAAVGCGEEPDFCAMQGLGTPCEGGDPCRRSYCRGAACVIDTETRECDWLDDACHVGVCNAARLGCHAEALPDGWGCEDGDLCTLGSVCISGRCEGGTLFECPAPPDPCWVAVCDPREGCRNVPGPDATECDDGVSCTTGDRCGSGGCAGEPTDVDGDGHPPVGCLWGDDCDDHRADINPDMLEDRSVPTSCSDGLDNDCDTATDSADRGCSG
jgi:hypothetical protein